MLITNYTKDALDEIKRIHTGYFPFPNLDDHTFIQKKIAIDRGKVIGCGFVKLTSEFILILDESASISSRVWSVLNLKNTLIPELKKYGIRDTHIFVDNSAVASFAERLGFEPCSPALTLQF